MEFSSSSDIYAWKVEIATPSPLLLWIYKTLLSGPLFLPDPTAPLSAPNSNNYSPHSHSPATVLSSAVRVSSPRVSYALRLYRRSLLCRFFSLLFRAAEMSAYSHKLQRPRPLTNLSDDTHHPTKVQVKLLCSLKSPNVSAVPLRIFSGTNRHSSRRLVLAGCAKPDGAAANGVLIEESRFLRSAPNWGSMEEEMGAKTRTSGEVAAAMAAKEAAMERKGSLGR